MKICSFIVAVLSSFLLGSFYPVHAQSTESKTEAGKELKALVGRVEAKFRSGMRSKEDLLQEIKAFDDLWEKYKNDPSDEAGEILFVRGILQLNVVGDQEKGIAILEEVKKAYPNAKYAQMIDPLVGQVKQRAAAQKKKEELVGKDAPELDFLWVNQGTADKLSSLKGKVVLVDFWATWCGPCVASFPNIKEVAEHYKGYDVEIIGVTSLQGRITGLEAQPIDCMGDPEKEKKLMAEYIKAKDLNWTIAISKQEVFNVEYGVTGIPHMAIVAPDGKVRYNGLHPSSIDFAKKKEMIDELLKEFKLKTPPAL